MYLLAWLGLRQSAFTCVAVPSSNADKSEAILFSTNNRLRSFPAFPGISAGTTVPLSDKIITLIIIIIINVRFFAKDDAP